MKVNSFFKILNRKINIYDKLASNPFTDKSRMIVIWIEESDGCTKQSNKNDTESLN